MKHKNSFLKSYVLIIFMVFSQQLVWSQGYPDGCRFGTYIVLESGFAFCDCSMAGSCGGNCEFTLYCPDLVHSPIAIAPSPPLVLENDIDVALSDNFSINFGSEIDQFYFNKNGTPSASFTITGGTLTIGTEGISFYNGGNGSQNFTASGTTSALNSALKAATFTPTPNLYGIAVAKISYQVNARPKLGSNVYPASNNASVQFDIFPNITCDLNVSLGPDRFVYYGLTGYPGTNATIIPTITGGVAPFTYSWFSEEISSVNDDISPSITPIGYTDAQEVTYTVTVIDMNDCTATSAITLTYFDINCSKNDNSIKVKVCHISKNNPSNCKSICVSENAYQSMLDDGSYLGACLPLCAIPSKDMVSEKLSSNKSLNDPIEFNVKAFPNPTNNHFELKMIGGNDENVQVIVYDMMCRIVKQFKKTDNELPIYIGKDLNTGIYFVELRQGENRKTLKLLKN